MKSIVQFITLLVLSGFVSAQGISKKLADAVRNLEDDGQMKSGILGLYVVNQQTGAVMFNKNAAIGFAIASSQKVFTSIASLELLRKDYRYKTSIAYSGTIANNVLNGSLYLTGSGDPTLGSWRYDNTKEQALLNKWMTAIKQAGINSINGDVVAYNNNFETQTTPGGWIWDDIGNYYGAGVSALNWRENQYDLKLKSGTKAGDKVSIVATVPTVYDVVFTNELTTGKPGSGDNAYIYLPPYATAGFIRGTIPPHENAFTVSGSFPNPTAQMLSVFKDELKRHGIELNATIGTAKEPPTKMVNLITHLSPPLDSINYWFLKKSINLYGEALVKTLGYENQKQGSTEVGLKIIKSFWNDRGIDETSINMYDGSGLSPQNRITPEALVKAMQYARKQSYYNSFYNALPEINGIKMKSGSIGGVRSFTGYVNGYTFAIVINNYNGSSSEIVGKMYKVLDLLK